MYVLGLTRLESAEKGGGLETQAGVNTAVLRQNFFRSGKPQFCTKGLPVNG